MGWVLTLAEIKKAAWARGLKVDIWYDRQSRNWIAQLKNNKGYQVGEAQIGYRKEDTYPGLTARLKEYNKGGA